MADATCQFCQELLSAKPQCTLACGHQVHTQCYTEKVIAITLSDYMHSDPCQHESCLERILPDEWVTEGNNMADQYDALHWNETQTGKEGKDLEETCPKFNEDIKKLKSIHRQRVKARSAFMKILNKEKKDFNTITKSAISILRTNIRQVRTKLKETPEYKAFCSKTAKYTRIQNKLLTDWNLSSNDLRMYLLHHHRLNELWARWRYLPKYELSRNFRIFIN